jgi:hypothetical protein
MKPFPAEQHLIAVTAGNFGYAPLVAEIARRGKAFAVQADYALAAGFRFTGLGSYVLVQLCGIDVKMRGKEDEVGWWNSLAIAELAQRGSEYITPDDGGFPAMTARLHTSRSRKGFVASSQAAQ